MNAFKITKNGTEEREVQHIGKVVLYTENNNTYMEPIKSLYYAWFKTEEEVKNFINQFEQ